MQHVVIAAFIFRPFSQNNYHYIRSRLEKLVTFCNTALYYLFVIAAPVCYSHTCLLQPHLFVIDGEGHSSTGTVQDTQSVMSFHSSISSHSSRPSHHYKDALSRDAARAANQASQAAVEAHAAPIALQPLTGNQPLGSKVTVTSVTLSIFYSF